MEKLWSVGLEQKRAQGCITQIWGAGGLCVCTGQGDEREEALFSAGNKYFISSEPLETTFSRNSTLGHEKVQFGTA